MYHTVSHFVFAELPTPSTLELTFINISSVNISWHFDFSIVNPAQNVCFGIEYENNTRIANVSSLICGRKCTFYVFRWLLYGQIYHFKVIATDGVRTTFSDWSYRFINGAKGKCVSVCCVRVCACACVRVCMHVSVYACEHMCVCACFCTHAFMDHVNLVCT